MSHRPGRHGLDRSQLQHPCSHLARDSPPGPRSTSTSKTWEVTTCSACSQKKCGVGVVIPDSIDFKLTFGAGKIPCGAVFEDILEAHGLWYVYEPDAALVRIVARKELDAEDEASLERVKRQAALQRADDAFPAGKAVDLDLKNAPMRDIVVSLASLNGYDALVPETIGGAVTVVAKAPWNRVFPALLASHGLWYRLHGKVIRIAPRRELDAEDEAEPVRHKY